MKEMRDATPEETAEYEPVVTEILRFALGDPPNLRLNPAEAVSVLTAAVGLLFVWSPEIRRRSIIALTERALANMKEHLHRPPPQEGQS